MRAKKILFILFLICFSTYPVYAQEDLSAPVTFSISLPENLAGYKLAARDGAGTILDITEIDSTGMGSVTCPPGTIDILVNTEEIKEITSENEIRFSLDDFLISILIAVVFSSVISYILGRKKARAVLNELRDLVYEKDLD